MSIKGMWADRKPESKFLLLMGMILLGYSLSIVFSILIIQPVFGIDVLRDPAVLKNISDPQVLKALKFTQFIYTLFVFLFPALLAVYTMEPWERSSGIERKINQKTFVLVLALMIAIQPLVNWIGYLNQEIHLPASMKNVENVLQSMEEAAKNMTEAFLVMPDLLSLMIMLILVAVLPAVAEEILFRGVIQRVFHKWLKNIHVSIFLTAFIFSALHAQFYGLIPRMLLGVILGYLFYWSGNIWVSILAHFFNNAMGVIFPYLLSKGRVSQEVLDAGTHKEQFWMVMLSMIFTGTLLFLIRKEQKRHQMS